MMSDSPEQSFDSKELLETQPKAEAVVGSEAENVATHQGMFRWLGFLPLVFFIAQAIFYWRNGSLGNMLWMCNIGNLLLAIALLIGYREMIRATAIWTIPGLVVWFLYVILPYGFVFSSTLAHVGGFIVAMIALRKVRVDRHAWLYAFIWYLVMEAISRLTTSPDLNVNVVYQIQSGWELRFTSFWKFWLLMTVVVAVGLWVIGRVLNLIWPGQENF